MDSETQTAADIGCDRSGSLMPQDEREHHEKFMREALAMAELALQTDETPVGCVLVHDDRIIARGMNATNRTLNGTRHAEFIAVNELLSPSFPSDPIKVEWEEKNEASCTGNEGTKPSYHEKLSLLRESDLYVTVEPCIMCASFLRQLGIKKVYFGAINDRFGGTGGVLNIHDMEYPSPDNERNRGYQVSGGWLREEAIMLLRKFYVQENEKAPEPRNKKERQLKTEIAPMSIPGIQSPS